MTTPTQKRLRALRIREAALGFSDDVSCTLIGIAEELEAEAKALEKEQEVSPSPPPRSP